MLLLLFLIYRDFSYNKATKKWNVLPPPQKRKKNKIIILINIEYWGDLNWKPGIKRRLDFCTTGSLSSLSEFEIPALFQLFWFLRHKNILKAVSQSLYFFDSCKMHSNENE